MRTSQNRLLNWASTFPKQAISYLENTEQSVYICILSGLFAVVLRSFLEAFSQKSGNYFNLDASLLYLNVVHFSLSYCVVALTYCLLFYFATKTDILKIIKVIFPSLILLFIAPIIDLFTSLGTGRDIYYFSPFGQSDLFKNYFTYTSYFSGITLGMKVEVLIMLWGCFCYFRYKGVALALSFIYTLLTYSCNFIFACSLIIVYKVLSRLGFDFIITDISLYMIYFYSFCLLVSLLWIFQIANKKLFFVLFKDLRMLKVLHYEFMLFLGLLSGFVISTKTVMEQLHLHNSIVPEALCTWISIFFAAIFSIVQNNIFDLEIDKINSPHRPLIQDQIDIRTYEKSGWIAFCIALYFAVLAGTKACFIMLSIIALYYLYSVPPIRFKRVLFLSKLTISGSSLALVILGHLIVAGNLSEFPKYWYAIFLIGVTLSANMLDLKDHRGDALFGIKTLPVVAGPERAKILIGMGYLLTSLAFYFVVLNKMALLLLIGMGVMQYYLINRKQFIEWPSMIIHLGSLLIVTLTLCSKLA